MKQRLIVLLLVCMLVGALASSAALAHAFPDRQHPGAGDTVERPHQVRIRFDSPIEPAFSHLNVKNSAGEVVSKHSHLASRNPRLLEADLPPLKAGQYHVYWRVVARDGHPTQGDYTFTVAH